MLRQKPKTSNACQKKIEEVKGGEKMIKTKKEQGITLVALIITIIILVILAAVSIRAAYNSGIIEYAVNGTQNYVEGSTKESSSISEAEGLMQSVVDKLEELAEGGNTKTISIGGTDVTVGASAESLAANYGDTVDSSFFSSVEGVSWQLFYDDVNYVFLIASDYVENSKLPCVGETVGNTTYTVSDGLVKSRNTTNSRSTYCAYFDASTPANLLLTSPYSSGSAATTITSNPLSRTYLKWATDTTNGYPNSTNNNIKAVAYMMDTSKWSSFAGNTYTGTFAIGGPTVELFVKSYNAKHPGETTELGTYDTITSAGETANVDSNGYKVKIGIGSWTDYVTLNTSDNMWAKASQTKANGYWLASPSSWEGGGRLNIVGYDLNLSAYPYDNDRAGFRPLVCIPKASI